MSAFAGAEASRFHVALTGSYPPLTRQKPLDDTQIAFSIAQAVAAQAKAATNCPGAEWVYVSGQPRDDIIGIFGQSLGLTGNLPFDVREPLRLKQETPSIQEVTLTANSCGQKPMKWHIVGPFLFSSTENVLSVSDRSPSRYQPTDPGHRRNLMLDVAHAQAAEIRSVLEHCTECNVRFIQIDEPTLASAASHDLDVEMEALSIIREASSVPVILHVYLNFDILEFLLAAPFDILNVEWRHMKNIHWLTRNHLTHYNKRLALGCIPVNRYLVKPIRKIEQEMRTAIDRFGKDRIWGITPNSALRWSTERMSELYLDQLSRVAEHLTHYSGGSFNE